MSFVYLVGLCDLVFADFCGICGYCYEFMCITIASFWWFVVTIRLFVLVCWIADLGVCLWDWCVISVFSEFCVALYLVCVVLLGWFGVWFVFLICVKLFTVACCSVVVVEGGWWCLCGASFRCDVCLADLLVGCMVWGCFVGVFGVFGARL